MLGSSEWTDFSHIPHLGTRLSCPGHPLVQGVGR